MNGNFAAQLSDGSQLSKVEIDKIIEDTKTLGGCTNFTRIVNSVKKEGKSMRPTEQHCLPVSINILIINLRSTSTLISILHELKRMKMMYNVF